MKAFYIPKLGLSGLTSTALVEKGRNHVQDCTANANVTLPAGFLTSMTAACDALEAANLAVLNNGGRQDTLVRNERKRELEDLVRQLAGYVQAQCEGDQEKIASTGFETRKQPSPVGVVEAPKNLRAQRGKLAGEVDLRWDRVQGRLMYAVYVTEGDPKEESGWTLLAQLSKNFHTATRLVTDKAYSFRTLAIGTAGAGPASDSAESKAA